MEKNSLIAGKPEKCEFCGNNPVPHFVFWYFESVNILLSPIRRLFLKFRPPAEFLPALVSFAAALGIVSFREDKRECKVERARVLWDEAEKRNIQMRELLLFGRPFDVYQAVQIKDLRFKIKEKRGDFRYKQNLHATKIVFSGLPRPKNLDRAALDEMDDKALLKQKFSAAGLPVPRGGGIWRFSQAKKIFQTINKPAIVKPRAGSRGRHTTTFVSSLEELKAAYGIAKQLCFWVMVEEQLFGPVYRATVINYELCGVLRGDSPRVSGDGKSSLLELINKKNNQDHPGVKNIIIDKRLVDFLARQNLALSNVPLAGTVINLSEKIGVNYGGSSSEDFEICHKDNKTLFERAAKVVSDPIVGFDFIIPDITKSWKSQKCGFIEANSLPFINLHHHPLYGRPGNVAAKVWDLVLSVKDSH